MVVNSQARLLCVDNHEDSRDMLTILMRISGIEVQAVANAAQALSKVEKERFDLYLLEARLPGLDGFELCRRLRSFRPETPVVFFSAAAYEDDKKKALAAGASAYVTKPDVVGLLGRVKQMVARPQYAVA